MIEREFNPARWFAEQVQPHEPMLRAWLRVRFPKIPETDDILQEAYARILRAQEREALANPKAFLFAIARNLALDHLRRNQQNTLNPLADSEPNHVLDEREGIPETLAHNQDLEFLTQAIQSLPDRCRQVLTLRKIYGLSQKEIARQLGISEHTVESQVTIGVKKCAEFLSRHREQ